ncbi:serpin family protein [Perlabentimonas gracilis]|uniref:serpin family protein n=1 Tax=Perlabentimonas gracilis TaxID=2715279 RepID=UPI001408A7AA|nr:serpin family protein [Perlabentimonas gracilis]NHB69421.1 serpin family protein [Perlabentimonas gracilis]
MKTSSLTLVLMLIFSIANSQQTSYTATEANSFALSMYKQFAQADNDNVFFSPISISMALGMTYAGADGETKKQISEVLNFPYNDKNFHAQMGQLQSNLLDKQSEGVDIALANQLWAENSYRFKCRYLRTTQKLYNSPVKRLDFSGNPNASRIEINQWVEELTRDRIKDLLPDGSISSLTKMVLTNAIYFKGQWDKKFEAENTRDDIFTTLEGKQVKTPMMNAKEKFNVYQGDGISLLELPYQGNDFSMLVLLPNEDRSIGEIERGLSVDNLNEYISKLSEKEVQLMFPKFKFDAEYQLKPVLSDMGMPIAFSNAANLSRMSRSNDLKIDEVFHKAFVEVSEEGTEAAAATAVVIVLKSITMPVEFFANRPFIFIIRENKDGNILFMGRVTNPNI